jgi:hypothetical protein
MRRYLLYITLICAGCKSGSNDLHTKLTGNWFIVYPEEELKSKQQEKIYAGAQDSLVTLKGVKLITLEKNGAFIQWDSTQFTGKWGTVDEKMVVVSGAGTGFQNFKAEFSGLAGDELILTEFVNVQGERIKLNWHLKRIVKGDAATLFDARKNEWRKKPAQEETELQMRERLSAMLAYYSIYFKLIADKSSYFMPVRVMLPVKFYQHAIGMKDFDPEHRFVSLFHSVDEAKKAYGLLKDVVNHSSYNFPESNKNSYSSEYAQMLEKLSEEIKAAN